jgi:uncharacterized protein YkwD
LAGVAALAALLPTVAQADDEPAPAEPSVEAMAAVEAPTDVPAPEAPAAPVAPAAPTTPAEPPLITPLEMQTLALVNGARAGRGLPPLQWDQTMTEVARGHAADMLRRGIVSHAGADGSSPVERLRRAGVKFQFGSENIWTYWGRVPELGPSTMHAAMMAEPFAPGLWNHVGNILYTGYRRIGIGLVTSPDGVQYLSETFAD